jgi:hypothetical protein
MNEQIYKSIITKCWGDPEFKRQFIADPVGILRSEGIALPDGIEVRVVENTANEFTFVIPPEPSELSDEALDGVAGGKYNRLPTQTSSL